MQRVRFFSLAIAAVAACTSQRPAEPTPDPTPYDAAAPRAITEPQLSQPEREALALAERATHALKQRLGTELKQQMQSGGAAQAVDVCAQRAEPIRAEVAAQLGVRLGRTSHKLRTVNDTAPDWVQPYLDAAAGRRGADVKRQVVDLGDSLGLLDPLTMVGLCKACHGPTRSLAPEVQAYLAEHYANDEATGFEVGDFRGFVWVEVPKAPPQTR